jgi:hypothetical protein
MSMSESYDWSAAFRRSLFSAQLPVQLMRRPLAEAAAHVNFKCVSIEW